MPSSRACAVDLFCNSLVMIKPEDFKDLLKRITPYIHLEEAQVARRVETEGREKKNASPQKKK